MARLFDDALSQYLEKAEAIVTAAPLTMACWFYDNDTSVDQHLMTITDTGSNTHEFSLALNRANPTTNVTFMGFDASASVATVSSAAWSANTWHHACGVCAAVNDWRVYLDGGNKGTDTTSVTPAGLDTTDVGRRNRLTGGSRYMSGRIAEAAVWSAALDDAEVAALSKGICPLLIRPQSLVAYWPLFGNDATEIDRWKNRHDLTVTGATKADHPRIFYSHQIS